MTKGLCYSVAILVLLLLDEVLDESRASFSSNLEIIFENQVHFPFFDGQFLAQDLWIFGFSREILNVLKTYQTFTRVTSK